MKYLWKQRLTRHPAMAHPCLQNKPLSQSSHSIKAESVRFIHSNYFLVSVFPFLIKLFTSIFIDENRSPRIPVPVNTTQWVSTPRNQLNALLGTDFLNGIEQLEIQQTVQLSTCKYYLCYHICDTQVLGKKEMSLYTNYFSTG